MLGLEIIKNILVFMIVYIPPFLVFAKFWRERKRSDILLVLIGTLYIVSSVFIENFIPFVFVLINIRYIKYTSEFSIKNFKFIKALNLTVIFYIVNIGISTIQAIILTNFKVELKHQEIVTNMVNMPLEKFLIMIPVVIIFAPILEEFVFRWLLFEKIFSKAMGVYLAAFLSSIIFAMIHFSLNAFAVILWVGLYNCYLMNKKGYWYAVFNHFVFNSITVVALLIGKIKLM
ncbi:CPBP family intramembrane glutamic endopeptidase [Clostridium sp. WILCCON 0269]|uniref:CPBP family intramembrane glutamic endopeptidase n=1 Tax=Candidatus Clostridium eludens TaxID=3381663 RepID=A0ABW8SEZ2_9CLOT